MIKIVWKCINTIAISPKRGMEQAEIIDTFWTYHPRGDVQPFTLKGRSGLRIEDRSRSVCGLQDTVQRQSYIMPLGIVRCAWLWLPTVPEQIHAGICPGG